MALLQSVRDYFQQRSQTRALAQLIGRHHVDPTQRHGAWHALGEADRSVVMAACESGAVPFLAPGIVDGLVRTPELALILLQHGAPPTDALVHALHTTVGHGTLFMGRLSENAKPGSVQSWMRALLNTAVDRHPGLDWFVPIHEPGKDFPSCMAIHTLNLHSEDLCRKLCQRRQEEGIALAPLRATPQQQQALVNSLLSVYADTHWWLPYNRCGQMVVDTLKQGGDVDGFAKAATGEQELCVIARATRRFPERVKDLLAMGAKVDATVVGQVAYVMHDRNHYTRLNREAANEAFKQVVEALGETIDLDMVVPSYDYHRPSLATVLGKHYPDTLDDLRWRHQANRLEETTEPAPTARPRPRL